MQIPASGPILRLTGPGGDGALSTLELSTYDAGTNAPSARIQAIDQNWSSHLDFLTKQPGGNTNALVSRLRISNDGNVGIGTTAPEDARLDVEGNLRLNHHDLFLREGSDRSHGLGWYGTWGTDKPFTGVDVDGPVLYGYGGGALGSVHGELTNIALRWTSDQRVGIGTATPATALEVNGTIQATAFVGNGAQVMNLAATNLAGTIPDARLSTNVARLNSSPAFSGTVTASGFIGGGAGLTGVNADLLDGLQATDFWKLSGNSGTTPGTHFLGTTDNKALEWRVNNARCLRIEPTDSCANIISGSEYNSAKADARGGTIGGGGNYGEPNSVGGLWSTVGGGSGHTIGTGTDWSSIGGGEGNTIQGADSATISGGSYNSIAGNASSATIGGGWDNDILAADRATIGGGQGHRIGTNANYALIGGGVAHTIGTNAHYAAIGGGQGNTIQAGSDAATVAGGSGNLVETLTSYATIAGGFQNKVRYGAQYAAIGGGRSCSIQTNALYGVVGGGIGCAILTNAQSATVPGGYYNYAGGDYSFAAGRQAKAVHDGTFVWADSQAADYSSSANNQFLIRASGGVGIGKANPATALDVNGTVTATAFNGSGAGLTALNGAALTAGTVGAAALADGAVTSAKIANSAVTSAKIADSAVATVDLADTAVTSAKLASDAASLAKVSAGNLAVSGANVGIGTAGPVAKLDVRDGTGANGNGGTIHVGADTAGADAKLIKFGDGDYVHIGENGADDRMELKAGAFFFTGGSVGIGRVAAANQIEVEGTASKTVAGNWVANSDARIKTGIATVTNALDTLARVRLVSFRYTDAYRAAHPSVEDRRYLNVVAQEFRDVFPDAVKSSGEKLAEGGDEMLQVDTYPLTIYSAAAVQELHQQLKAKDAEIQALTQRLEEIERRLPR